jgi:methyltransferase family protein
MTNRTGRRTWACSSSPTPGADLIEHHASESQIVLPRLLAEGRQFDLAVVDGAHRFDAVFVDLYYLGRLVHRGGIIFLYDYQLSGVARGAAFFTANLGWTTGTRLDKIANAANPGPPLRTRTEQRLLPVAELTSVDRERPAREHGYQHRPAERRRRSVARSCVCAHGLRSRR